MTDEEDRPMNQMTMRPRAAFSTEDFSLIRTAVLHYLKEVQDKPESVKYAALYHRLGRIDG